MANALRTGFDLSTGAKTSSLSVLNNGKGLIQVLYLKTIVFTFKETPKTKVFTLDDGGWDTVSTRFAINRAMRELFLPYELIRKKKRTMLFETNKKIISEFMGSVT